MSKDTVADWDPIAANNTDVGGVAITGASSVRLGNDAIQTMMAQISTLKPLGVGDGAAAKPTFGQCVLTKSGTSLKLAPANGNLLTINGVPQVVPSAGITLAPPATNNTSYYIYAYMNSGTMTLEASTTANVTDSTTGMEVKSGDATRTLVGLARTVSSAWVDTDALRYVRSWFNELPVRLYAILGSNTNFGNSTFTKISANLDCIVLAFEGERILASITGTMWGSGSAVTSSIGIGIDTSSAPQASGEETPTAASHSMAVSAVAVSDVLSVGIHTITGCGRTAGTSVASAATIVTGTILPRA